MNRAGGRLSLAGAVIGCGGLLARDAYALCPNCLGQNRALTPTLELLGAFLLVPFVVGYFVLRAIRRATR